MVSTLPTMQVCQMCLNYNIMEKMHILGPQAVSFVERLSLFQSVHYQRFTIKNISVMCACSSTLAVCTPNT